MRTRRPALATTLLLGLVYLVSAGHGGCGSDDHGDGLPAKDRVFTKTKGPRFGGLVGEDTRGTCAAEEKGKAACYGDFLVHCSEDGHPHAFDCTKQQQLTMRKCVETTAQADCE